MKNFFKALVVIVILLAVAIIIIYAVNDKGAAVSNTQSSSSGASSGIVLNEMMADNKGVLADDNGAYSDWVEIYNSSNQDVNLHNYALSDDAKEPRKWPFPDFTLKAHGYIVIYLSGTNTNNLDAGIIHSTIKLSSKGDKLILTDAAGQEVDKEEFSSMPANVSIGRSGGEWKVFTKPTPGFENSDAGYKAFLESRKVKNPQVLINEVMTSNSTTVADNTGNYSDWVEVVNVGSADVNLNGYGLSDKPENPMKWKFPDVTIKPGETLVVFCSGNADASAKDPKKGLQAGFRLASYKETVTLSNTQGLTLDSAEVDNISTDHSYARTYQNGKPTSTWADTGKPTPGYPNTDDGFSQFQKNNQLALGDIIISEVMTSNSKLDLEGDKKTYDYIEVENRGAKDVNLKNYGLTTNPKNPAKFRFPDVTIKAGQQMLVLATGEAQAQKKKYLHAPFSLSAAGETLALFDASDKLIDKYNIGYMPPDISMGREEGKGSYSYFTTPTPGQPNGKGAEGMAGDVTFDKQSGSYENSVSVTLAASDGSDIYYTVDGSIPTQSSLKYTSAVNISKTSVIRARAYKNSYLPGRTCTETFLVNPKHTLPVISISTDHGNLFDPKTGIYEVGPNAQPAPYYLGANYLQRGGISERPASFEIIDEKGKRVFNQDIAIRIQGGYSRYNQQKSFAIIARSQYGSSTMKYKFFDNLPFTEYKSVILRDGGQDQKIAKIKEAVVLSLAQGKINCLTQSYKAYVVYINGEYWGVYFMEEKRNKYFVAQHENVKNPDSINLLLGSGLNIVKNGTNAEYKKLIAFVGSHDMTQKANFDYVAARLDTDSFMDLMINEIYIGNSDYANLEFYQVPGGKWYQIFYDFCWTFPSDNAHPTLMHRTESAKAGSTMLNGLLKYQPWKEKFLQRFAWTMKNIYPTDRVLKTIDQVANSVASEMPAERAKFTDTSRNWDAQVEKMRTFAKKRPAIMVQQIQSFFNLSPAQTKQLFGDIAQ